MKKAYIITYELSNPGRNYELLLKRIKSYGDWARLTNSSYIILVDYAVTTIQVRDYLTSILVQNDKIYVGELKKSAAWYGLGEEVSNWIRNNQT